eukprot:Gregarina_sp_Pseudo_9__2781@NODE_3016_length_786_cov_9_441767_g2752_i0_p1_GENE_NODE_3016_length_786_cov_9_441767_g2752_i0NODE_3016_length_786_cov_9_441767_g2752_i0_p1_ORF_typecomplete_len194_score7_07Hexapep/PF00132_24/0_084Hexapep/PF00132_24/6_8e06Hexapep/PF00132_24/4_6e03Hexapep_2/PF14602_6/2_8e02Hexapep_2/PF14602_6/0_04Hexapep_2/PF14602_6/2_4e03Fucokinase/PF07959_12/0_22_NODE_3016_length_786_cov_9_441767_g2752_i0149730
MSVAFPFYNNPTGGPPYEPTLYVPAIEVSKFDVLEPHRIRIERSVKPLLEGQVVTLDLESTICAGLKVSGRIQFSLGESSFIAPNVKLQQPRIADQEVGIEIGKFTVIGPGAEIAASRIGHYCEIGHHAKIGERCLVQDGCIIAPYTDLRPDTVCPSGTVWAGTPGVYVGDAPADGAVALERKCRDLRELTDA